MLGSYRLTAKKVATPSFIKPLGLLKKPLIKTRGGWWPEFIWPPPINLCVIFGRMQRLPHQIQTFFEMMFHYLRRDWIAFWGQVAAHFRHPIHSAAWSTCTCWCWRREIIPSTCRGQVSTQFPQATHNAVLIFTKAVRLCRGNGKWSKNLAVLTRTLDFIFLLLLLPIFLQKIGSW